AIVRENPEEELSMVVLRNGEEVSLTVVPDSLPQLDMDGEEVMIGQVGVRHAFEKSFFGTFEWGFTQTYETTQMILTNLMMLITGQVSIELLSGPVGIYDATDQVVRSEEHTSELQSRFDLVCRLLLENKR